MKSSADEAHLDNAHISTTYVNESNICHLLGYLQIWHIIMYRLEDCWIWI